MSTLFISDLHLCADRPEITELFLGFLRGRARRAEALYILGDLFEYWIGDEAIHQDEFRSMVHGMRDLSASGVALFFIRGNRDFLMGAEFERATGGRMLADPTVADLYGERVLLMHGDTLCTDDAEYMAFRAVVRTETWRREFLAKSVAKRDAMVRSYREISKTATARKKPEIMDVTQQAVETVMRAHGVRRLIHGHTHRPGEHVFDLGGTEVRRMVLGDWYEQGSLLVCDDHGWVLEALALSAKPAQSGSNHRN